MVKFAAIVRRSLLSLFMIFLLILCVTKAEINTSLGTVLYMGTLISGGAYFIFSAISIIVRLIRRKLMDENDAIRSAYTDTLLFLANSHMISYFRSIAFWGTILLLINIFVLHVPSSMIVEGPYSPDLFLRGYHGFLLWSLISLIPLYIISALFFTFYLPHYGTGVYNVFQYIGKLIFADIVEPFRAVKGVFFKNEEKMSFNKILRFITLLVFVVINVLAIIKTI